MTQKNEKLERFLFQKPSLTYWKNAAWFCQVYKLSLAFN